ncbi:conserved hypothetical protein [Mesorhizobium prunaredense]|uniref:Uncharacterized protein n=1 Tax=Mesorhizobium prunaredense TaxID=1631249 RepID=A0A1R3V8N8_9HYPH|nr:conserved hypothetical protein [Mesorhizobium prunaredense]
MAVGLTDHCGRKEEGTLPIDSAARRATHTTVTSRCGSTGIDQTLRKDSDWQPLSGAIILPVALAYLSDADERHTWLFRQAPGTIAPVASDPGPHRQRSGRPPQRDAPQGSTRTPEC